VGAADAAGTSTAATSVATIAIGRHRRYTMRR
jgi:hypothetical protein